MSLKELSLLLDSLDEKQRLAILSIIDHKTNQDMKEVINHIDAFKNNMDGFKAEMKAEITALKWMFGALGILITLITTLATILTIVYR